MWSDNMEFYTCRVYLQFVLYWAVCFVNAYVNVCIHM